MGEGRGLGAAASLDIAAVGVAAELLGLSLEAFERTMAYLRERKQFGRVIGSFQGLQHRAAALFAELELARSIVLRALQAVDAGCRRPAAAGQRRQGQALRRRALASNEGIQMHGGIGMTDEYDIGFFLKRARRPAAPFSATSTTTWTASRAWRLLRSPMGDYLRQLDEAVSPAGVDRGRIGAALRPRARQCRRGRWRRLPQLRAAAAEHGRYFQLMLNHADKDFAVYREERYTFGEAYWIRGPRHRPGRGLRRRQGRPRGDPESQQPAVDDGLHRRLSIGAVAVPMNAWWTTEELDYGLRDCGARVVIADRQRIERLAPLQDPLACRLIAIDDCAGLDGADAQPSPTWSPRSAAPRCPRWRSGPDDHATIMYTSGSTGHPKGALSSHRGILSALYSWMLLGLAGKPGRARGASSPAFRRRAC
jgi:hypothetical protein